MFLKLQHVVEKYAGSKLKNSNFYFIYQDTKHSNNLRIFFIFVKLLFQLS